MAVNKRNDKINDLLRRGKWPEARNLLERERAADPDNHWLLTQLGVTFYEQGQYEDALKLFLASREIVPDCPLTLWNLAGTLDSLGKYSDALSIYTWVLQSNKSPEDDPCWESRAWTDVLKTDCVYRLGVCFQHLGKRQKAEQCYHQYLNLLAIGINGMYSIEDVKRQLQKLLSTSKSGGTESQFRKAVIATLQISGVEPKKGCRRNSPEINFNEIVAGRRGANKR